MSEARDAPDVGSLGEETAKLLGALSGWAREQAGGAGEGLGGAASQAAAQAAAHVHELDQHLATGSAECTVCPLCRAVHAVRQLSPEVTAHLTSAVDSLVQAASAFMATADPRSEGGRADARADGGSDDRADGGDAADEEADVSVEHIDVGDDWPEDG